MLLSGVHMSDGFTPATVFKLLGATHLPRRKWFVTPPTPENIVYLCF